MALFRSCSVHREAMLLLKILPFNIPFLLLVLYLIGPSFHHDLSVVEFRWHKFA